MIAQPRISASLVALLTILASSGFASVQTALLLNHGGGGLGPDYGLRIDNGSGQTFSFETKTFANGGTVSTAGVFFRWDPAAVGGTDTASITGDIIHNQSGDTWALTANLQNVLLTNKNVSDWQRNSETDLYNEILFDLQNNGENSFSASANDLKTVSTANDRLGFRVVDVTIEYQSDGNAATTLGSVGQDYTIGAQTGSTILFDEYPNTLGDIAFVISVGHRLDSTTDTLTGIGWLQQAPDLPKRGTQDFLFTFDQVTEPETGFSVPEPFSLAVWSALAAIGAATTGRSRRARA